VHCPSRASKQVPVGGGGGHAARQSSFGRGQGRPAAHAWPVHCRPIVSKHCPFWHGPFARLQTPAARRWQSFEYVVPSHPQTGATRAKQAEGRGTHVPPVLLQVPGGHSQNSPAPQSVSPLQLRQIGLVVDAWPEAAPTGQGSEAARWTTILLHARRRAPAWTAALATWATQRTYWLRARVRQQLH